MALAIDPKITRAHGIIALTHINEGNNFWLEDPSQAFDLAHAAASKAVADDPRDPWAHAMLSITDLWRSRAYERAESEMR